MVSPGVTPDQPSWRRVSSLPSSRGGSHSSSDPSYSISRAPCACFAIAFLALQAFFMSDMHRHVLGSKDVVSSFILSGDSPGRRPASEGFGDWFDGCRMVYLDCGTNRGVQIRKLFEPELYPDAQVLPVFDQAFGPGPHRKVRKDLCAVGFEPNMFHTENLTRLEAAYKAQGWRVKIFTETAVGITDGNTTFHRTSPHHYDPGASLLRWSGGMQDDHDTSVTMMDLSRYILENIVPRRIHPAAEGEARNATVVMKIDVEGYEHTLLPQLFTTGAICHLDIVFAEMHYWGRPKEMEDVDPFLFLKVLQNMAKQSAKCPAYISHVDDETYDASDFGLPGIKQSKRRSLLISTKKPIPASPPFSSSSSPVRAGVTVRR